MNGVLMKNTLRLIKKSLGRFLAIVCILALGVGFFTGLTVTKSTMRQTAHQYVKESVFHDFRLLSTLGFDEEDLQALRQCEGVRLVAGGYFCDVLEQTDKGDRVLSALSLTEGMNLPQITVGRLPQEAGECLADARVFSADRVGEKLIWSDANDEDTLSSFSQKEYTVVGLCNSPEYMHMQRGNSKLGNGKVEGFVYLLEEDFTGEYYTQAYVKLTEDPFVFSEAYDAAADAAEPLLTERAENSVKERFLRLLSDARQELDKGEAKLSDAKQKLQDGKNELADGQRELQEARDEYDKGKQALEDGRKEWEENTRLWEENRDKLLLQEQQWSKSKEEFSALEASGMVDPVTLQGMALALSEGEKELAKAKLALEQAKTALDDAAREFLEGETELADAQKKIAEGEAELAEAEQKIVDGEKELLEGEQKVADAKEALEELEEPEIFTLSRYENVGYASFESDSTIVEGIAKVFPWLFFLVAALVCSTTMNKMVDNARTEMGTLKAVGYSDGAVVSQYLLYAFFAAFLGTALGFFALSGVFPQVIWIAYTMMYDFTDSLVYVFDPLLLLLSFGAALLCSVGVAFVSCKGALKELPASLIRPKAPKAGKRILLERLPFLWKRLGFFQKVSLRNIFRYKKRLIMMVLGIGGCMALLCVGFGLRDSIKNLVYYQYDEITVYDASFTFRDPMEEQWESFLTQAGDEVTTAVLLFEDTAELTVGQRQKELRLVIPHGDDLSDLVRLHNGGEPIAYPKAGEAVVNRKMAEQGGYRVGDSIPLRLSDGTSLSLRLSGICESYVSNYVYLHADTYREATGETPGYQTAYLRFASQADPHEAAARLRSAAEVNSVSLSVDMKNTVSDMMASMDYVIVLVVACAAALALVVLFNLGNINLLERQREIATLKVLGFQLSEVNQYVFRENLVLSVIGVLVGIPLGKLLHAFVMGEIRIDLVSFEVRISSESMLVCAVLTMAFTLLVNLILIPKLKGIHMATSLKSVE